VFVGPCGVATSLVDPLKMVWRDELPRINGAHPGRVANKLLGSMEASAVVAQRPGGAAVPLVLVDVDAFFILAGGAGWGRPECRAGARPLPCDGRSVKIPGIGDVVVDASQGGLPPVTNRDQARKESDGFEVLAGDVVTRSCPAQRVRGSRARHC